MPASDDWSSSIGSFRRPVAAASLCWFGMVEATVLVLPSSMLTVMLVKPTCHFLMVQLSILEELSSIRYRLADSLRKLTRGGWEFVLDVVDV